MGRHSRKGRPAPSDRGTDHQPTPSAAPGTGRRRRAAAAPAPAPEAQAPQYGAAQALYPQQKQYPSPPSPPSSYGPGSAGPYAAPQQRVRGGHPEQYEPGGGWGGEPYTAAPYATEPRVQARIAQAPPRIPGPRREFVEAFDASPPPSGAPADPAEYLDDQAEGDTTTSATTSPTARRDGRSGLGRTLTGITAGAITTVLAIVVAGQVADSATHDDRATRAADGTDRSGGDSVSRSEQRATPSQGGSPSAAPTATPRKPPSYEQLMARQFELDPKLKASGDFAAVPGSDPAPGKGRKVRYRVDVEKGLDLDSGLFAEAVQKTLNDDRSWAHGGTMTFERISSGQPDFVITLASPGTTSVWCAKSGLDTTIDNVSCDSASTQRIMINAYRWARGAETYGPDAMLAYRQMLINHEVGHRLGHNHTSCRTAGALAPVMQQQTKTLEIDGIKCLPNPWVYPGS